MAAEPVCGKVKSGYGRQEGKADPGFTAAEKWRVEN